MPHLELETVTCTVIDKTFMRGVKIVGTTLFFRPGFLFCVHTTAHNPKVEFALAIILEVELLRTNLIYVDV